MADSAVLTAIHERRSVRAFSGREVSREQLIELLRAAMAAPTGRNIQPWRFVAVDDRAVLDALADGLANAAPLRQAAAAVAVCGDVAKTAVPGTAYWVQDCALAAENLMLAAEAVGLASLYTGSWPYPDRITHITNVLGLPATVQPLCVVVVGYANGDDGPKDKWNEEYVHWNRWRE